MPIVAMPDGAHVQFPDEMPPDQIRALIQSRFPHVGSSGPRHGYVGTFDDPAPPKGSIFDFTDPAGKQYTVNGPAGSTPEQAFAILQQHLGQQPSGGKLGTTFDAEGARKAGYSEAEIRGVKGALAAGYTPQEISDHLSKPRGMFDDIPPVGDKQSSALPDGFIPDQPAAGSGGFLANAADFVKSMPEGAALPEETTAAATRSRPNFSISLSRAGPLTPGQTFPPACQPRKARRVNMVRL